MNQKEVKELTQHFRAGDDSAGWELVISQQHLIKMLVRRRNLDASIDEEDVISELQLSLHHSLRSYEPSLLTLSGYACMVVERRIGPIITRLAGIDSVPLTDVCVYPESQEQADGRELLYIVSDALDRIQPLHREVFVLWCQDASFQQIADAANRTLGQEVFNDRKAQRLVNDSVTALRAVLEKEIENLS